MQMHLNSGLGDWLWYARLEEWLTGTPKEIAEANRQRALANIAYGGAAPNPKPAPVPSAPQTQQQMYTWTPADLAAADRIAWDKWRADPFYDMPEPVLTWGGLKLGAGLATAAIIGGLALVLVVAAKR